VHRYGARLVFEGVDEFGPVEVVETADSRRLHFGNEVEQSRTFLFARDALGFGYFRAMASALLFQPSPRRILLLGLGGGALARWLLDRLPRTRIDAVELRPLVRDVAHRYFGLPRTRRLNVHIGDAARYARGLGASEYDLILVDVFDHEGMVESTAQWEFLDDCRRGLTENGVLGMNIWREDLLAFREVSDQFEVAFSERALYLPMKETANTIGFGFAGQLPDRHALAERAVELEALLGLDVRRQLNRLRRQNPGRL